MAKSSTKFNPTFLTFDSQCYPGSTSVFNEEGRRIGIIAKTKQSSLYRYLFLNMHPKDKEFANLTGETYDQLKTELIARYEKKLVKGKKVRDCLNQLIQMEDRFTADHPEIYTRYRSMSVHQSGPGKSIVTSIRFHSDQVKYRLLIESNASLITIFRAKAHLYQLSKRLNKA